MINIKVLACSIIFHTTVFTSNTDFPSCSGECLDSQYVQHLAQSASSRMPSESPPSLEPLSHRSFSSSSSSDYDALRSNSSDSDSSDTYTEMSLHATQTAIDHAQATLQSTAQASSVVASLTQPRECWNRSKYITAAQRIKRAHASNVIKRFFKRTLFKNSIHAHKTCIKDAAVINAIKSNDSTLLQHLIKEKKCPAMAHYDGDASIELAAHDDRIACFKVLLNNKADPNYHDQDGNSILYLTALNDELCTRALIDVGAHHTPVYHLARKVGEHTGVCITKYYKLLTIDNALILADRKIKETHE